jgi:hypothetical protein
VTNRLIRFQILALFISVTTSQLLDVGDIAPNFTIPYCENGEGDFNLYDECNGAVNGGNYKVTWLTLFASW